MSAVTGDRVAQFRERGYVFLPGYFDADRVEEFRDEADRMLELAVNSSLATGRTSGRLKLSERPDGGQSVRTVNPSLDVSRLFKELAVGELAALLEPLMEDDPVSFDRMAQLNYKMPLPEPLPLETDRATDRYPVHSDWAYYEGTWPPGVLTTAVFLDRCAEDSGPLQVWPGSHARDIDHESTDIGLQAPEDAIDHDAGEPVLGPAGSVLLFDARLVHSSDPNTSGRPRRLAIYGHGPAGNVDSDVVDGSARPEASDSYPAELVESTYENEYRRLKRRGEYEDRFEAPTFAD